MLRIAARSLLGVALAFSVATHAGAMTAWDQAKVTELAKQLEDAVSGLRDAVRNSPQWTAAVSSQAVLYQIRDDLRWIESEAQSLHAMLAGGDGMEATLNSYKRIQFLRRDAQQLAERAQVSAITQPKLDKAKAVLEQLASYYPADAAN